MSVRTGATPPSATRKPSHFKTSSYTSCRMRPCAPLLFSLYLQDSWLIISYIISISIYRVTIYYYVLSSGSTYALSCRSRAELITQNWRSNHAFLLFPLKSGGLNPQKMTPNYFWSGTYIPFFSETHHFAGNPYIFFHFLGFLFNRSEPNLHLEVEMSRQSCKAVLVGRRGDPKRLRSLRIMAVAMFFWRVLFVCFFWTSVGVFLLNGCVYLSSRYP